MTEELLNVTKKKNIYIYCYPDIKTCLKKREDTPADILLSTCLARLVEKALV
jgi:hypothetical protein